MCEMFESAGVHIYLTEPRMVRTRDVTTLDVHERLGSSS